MPSILLSDNGVSSGSAGLKTTAASDGSLALQTTTGAGAATTAVTIDTSQNVGVGQTSPAARLDLLAASGETKVILRNVGNSSDASTYVSGETGSTGDWANLGLAARHAIRFYSNNSEKMRLDSAGNLGLGVTPASWAGGTENALQVKNGSIYGYGTYETGYSVNAYYNGGWKYISTETASQYKQSSGVHSWYTAASGTAGNAISFTQAMTLTTAGNLLAGKTASGEILTNGFEYNNTTNNQYLSICNTGGSNYPLYVANKSSGSTSLVAFYSGSSLVGSITYNGSLTLYNTTSDRRLKENIVDAPEFGGVIDSIQVRSFDWKEKNSHQRAGFIAQELVTVAPEAVYQPADPEEMMAVDYSKLVPMLVKEIQSLRQRVAQLESN